MSSSLELKHFRLLEGGRTVHDAADAARAAALSFMAGTNGAWSRKDLALWLLRDYAAALGPGRRAKTLLAVDSSSVEIVALRTRERVLDMLATLDRSRAFGRDFVEEKLVTPSRDHLGALGYVPVDGSRLSLDDRVTSLFAADYLTRPADYASLVVCEDCGEVSFAWMQRHGGTCERRDVIESNVVPRLASAPRCVG
jgi:hypothetical protein